MFSRGRYICDGVKATGVETSVTGDFINQSSFPLLSFPFLDSAQMTSNQC